MLELLQIFTLLTYPNLAATAWLGWQDSRTETSRRRRNIRRTVFLLAILIVTIVVAEMVSMVVQAAMEAGGEIPEDYDYGSENSSMLAAFGGLWYFFLYWASRGSSRVYSKLANGPVAPKESELRRLR